MTDITELAQSMKSAATNVKETAHIARYLKATIARQTFKELMTPENILALVEALEKAQQRISQLESRTVTVKQYDEFQICHYGATEDYAKGYIDCQNNFSKWLTAAGIKVEAE